MAALDSDEERLHATVQALRSPRRTIIGLPVDVGIVSQAADTIENAIAALEGVDILINNAGANAVGTIDAMDAAQWERIIAVNLTSLFATTRSVWTRFSHQRRGVIVNMSSIMGLTGTAGSFAYCTCKAAIVGFTRSLAADGAPLGIRVNCICPGYVRTSALDAALSPAAQMKLSGQIPARRMAAPEEIADGVVYLSSDDASYANGTVLVLDGAATVGFAGCFEESDID